MITYNHENYISEAIEGVLMQECDFEVELIIADDASLDQTGRIVKKYIDSHPRGHWIQYARHDQNKGMMRNFVWALEQCKGKYIALCEGDDFWIDSKKISKQINFLEINSEFCLSFHSVNVLFPNGKYNEKEIGRKNIEIKQGGIVDLALYGNFIHTPSVVIRKNFDKIPDYFFDLEVGDFFLYLFVCENGRFVKQDFCGAVYRYGVGSFTSETFFSIRQRFKKSLFIASKNSKLKILKVILWLRFHQDQLYPNGKISIIYPEKSFLGFYNKVSLLAIIKSLIKSILGTETNKVS